MNARDQCARAARCALRLKSIVATTSIVLVTGRARAAHGEILGEAMERAVRAAETTPKDSPIGLDEASARLLGPAFEVTREPSLALLSERAEALATRRLLGVETPCVGREAELGALVLAWSQCVEESAARVCVVTADAGVGKSRLASELVARVREQTPGVAVWLARGDALNEHAPLSLVGKLVRDLTGIAPADPLELRRHKLRERARLARATHEDAAEFLGELCGAPFDDSARPSLRAARGDAQLMAARTREAFEALLASDAGAGPVLLVLEDLRWADAPSVAWFERAQSRLGERPALLLGLSRPEGRERFPSLFSGGSHAHMRPLTAKAAAKLARAVLGENVDSSTIERVIELAAGNAFYLEELLRAVAEGTSELPQTVVLMAQARLQALDAEARRVLRAASVFGESFSHDDVAALSDDDAAAEWLPRLVTLELLALAPGTADTYTFRHALLREAAYASLTDSDRVLGHKLAGEWLTGKGERNAMAVADHLARGEERAGAIVAYVRAAEQALQAGDLAAPDVALTRALACGAKDDEHGKLLALAARAAWQRGAMSDAEQLAREAMKLLERGRPYWYEALADLTNALQGRLENAEIERLSSELLATPTVGPVTASYARALSLAYSLLIQHAPDSELTRRLSQALETTAASDAANDPLIASRLAIGRAYGAVARKHPSAAALFELSARRFEEIGNAAVAQMQRTSQAIALRWLGDWEAAIAVLSAIPESSARPSRWARVFVAWPLARVGRAEEGLASVGAVLAQERDDTFLLVEARFEQARVLLSLGRHAEASAALAPALADESLPGTMRARLHAAELFACLARRDATEAATHAIQLGALFAAGLPLVEDAIYVQLAVIEHRVSVGDREGARLLATSAARAVHDYATAIVPTERARLCLELVPENARVLELAAALEER